jgi:hypothetical protein
MDADLPVFEIVRNRWTVGSVADDLAARPVRRRVSVALVLSPDTAIVAGCEPAIFRRLVREAGAEEIAEAVHQRDLERAARPPVIEVTVTTPPGGIRAAELRRVVAETVAEVTGPQRRVLAATRRAARRAALPPLPPVSEDDTPTMVLPAVRDEPEVVEVRIP